MSSKSFQSRAETHISEDLSATDLPDMLLKLSSESANRKKILQSLSLMALMSPEAASEMVSMGLLNIIADILEEDLSSEIVNICADLLALIANALDNSDINASIPALVKPLLSLISGQNLKQSSSSSSSMSSKAANQSSSLNTVLGTLLPHPGQSSETSSPSPLTPFQIEAKYNDPLHSLLQTGILENITEILKAKDTPIDCDLNAILEVFQTILESDSEVVSERLRLAGTVGLIQNKLEELEKKNPNYASEARNSLERYQPYVHKLRLEADQRKSAMHPEPEKAAPRVRMKKISKPGTTTRMSAFPLASTERLDGPPSTVFRLTINPDLSASMMGQSMMGKTLLKQLFDGADGQVDLDNLILKTPNFAVAQQVEKECVMRKDEPTSVLVAAPFDEKVWYFEVKFKDTQGEQGIGLCGETYKPPARYRLGNDDSTCGYFGNGDVFQAGRSTPGNALFTDQDIIGCEVDLDAPQPTAHFYINAVQQPVYFVGIPKPMKFMAFMGKKDATFEIQRILHFSAPHHTPLPNEVAAPWF